MPQQTPLQLNSSEQQQQQQLLSPVTQAQPQNLLDRLSGEVKNIIYRYVLLSPHGIPITSTGYAINSGLLGTSKQIRSDAQSIFYGENTFRLEIHKFNSKAVIRWFDHIHTFLPPALTKRVATHSTLHHEPCWKNLMVWLEEAHAGRCHAACTLERSTLRASGEDRVDMFVVVGLFETVWRMRMQSWSLVRDVVKISRFALIAANRGWAL